MQGVKETLFILGALVLILYGLCWAEDIDLEKIVITATKTAHLLKDVPATATIVTKEEIERKDTRDFGYLLEDLGGGRIMRYGGSGASSGYSLRGLFSVHTLILIDGRPLNSPDVGTAELAYISTSNIERIEVVRGPFSALYGSNAIGGVVNIITKPCPEKSTTNVSFNFGSWQRYKGELEQAGKINKLGYLLNTQYEQTDGHRDNSKFQSSNFNLKTEYPLLEGTVWFNSGYTKAKQGEPGAKPPVQTLERTDTQITYGNDEVSSLKDYFKGEDYFLHLGGEWKNLRTKVYFNRWKKDFYQPYAWTDFLDILHKQEATYKHLTKARGIEAEYDFLLRGKNIFTPGVSFTQDSYHYDSSDLDTTAGTINEVTLKADRSTLSFFLQDEIKFFEPLTLLLGVRFDDPSDYQKQFSPKGSILWKIDPKTNLRFSVGKAFRAPTLCDLYWPSDPYTQGNENLKPEKSLAYEIGLEKAFAEKIFLRTTLFYQKTTDMIQWAPTGPYSPVAFGPKWQPSNIGKVKTKGIELETKVIFNKNLDSRLGLTLLKSFQRTEEVINFFTSQMEEKKRYTRYAPNYKVDVGLNYKDFFGFDLDLNYQYIAKTSNYYLDWDQADGLTGNIPTTEKKLSGFDLVNLKISRQLKNWELYIAVNNLLDKEYGIQFGPTLVDQNYPMPGRNFTFGAKVNF